MILGKQTVDSPLAGTGGGVNDGLALLDLTEARAVLEQQLIISGRVQTADVDVSVALNAVLQALLEALALLGGGENSWDGSRDGRLFLSQGTKLCLSDTLALGGDLSNDTRDSELLRRGGGVAGPVSRHDARGFVAITHGSEEGSARSGLGSCGGVGSPTVLQARDISLRTLETITTVRGSTSRSEGNDVGAIGGRKSTRLHIGIGREASIIGLVRHDHAVWALGVIARVGDRNIRRGHVAAAGHDDRSSALGNVTISHAESAEGTDKTTKVVLLGLVVHATSDVVDTLGAVGSSHVLALVVGVLAGHDGVVEVRHGRFLQDEQSASKISKTRSFVWAKCLKGVSRIDENSRP